MKILAATTARAAMSLLARLRRTLRDRQHLAAMPGARWLAPILAQPQLWRLDRRRVAAGLALGVFFGVLIPVGAIFVAGLAAWLLRSNLPGAVLGTFVSNPLTLAPLYALAYGAGALVLGVDPAAEPLSISTVGKPFAVGLVMLAALGAAAVYASVHAVWRRTLWRRAAKRRPALQASTERRATVVAEPPRSNTID